MGNAGSSTNADLDDEEGCQEAVEDLQKQVSDLEENLDPNVLFDPKQLRYIADKIKEEASVNPLQQHHASLIRWVEERRSRGLETVTLMQFVDSFTNKGISKEVANELFQQFDVEGNGAVDLDYLHEMLDLSSRCVAGFTGVRSDLQAINKLLRDCFISPGFIDAFTSAKTVQSNHGQRLFKFLSKNRAPSASLMLPSLEGFVTSTETRLKVLQAHLNAVEEKADSKRREPPLQEDEVLKPINRCFTNVEVSSNKNEASRLTDKDPSTYWQSDGPARSHWIRLTIPPNVVIKQLSIYVMPSDQSYMPHHVIVLGGRDESNLRELNDVRIPNHVTGDFTLLENLKVPYPVIQLSIKRCHSDGCDTRVRQVRAIGYRVVKSRGVSVVDASAMWYLSVLASTAQAALPMAPHLREAIIMHTRQSLGHMNPLCLSSSSGERPGFLSTNVMEQMEKFLHSIICLDGRTEPNDLSVLLEFALARGSLGSILDVLKLVFSDIHCSFAVVPLLRNLAETEERAVRKHGHKLQMVVLSCDGGSKDPSLGPANLLRDNWKSDAYLTATGKTKCNLAFGLKSGQLIQLTRIFMKVSKGAIGPKAGLVFVFDSDNIKDESGAALFQPLDEYDDWDEDAYKRFKERIRDGAKVKEYDPVAYFTVDKDWADVDVVVDRIKTGSCVAIKFLGPRQDSAERLGIIGVNIFGYELSSDVVALQRSLAEHMQSLPDNDNENIKGIDVFLAILKFLQVMSRDAINVKMQTPKDGIVDKDATIDLYDISMKQLWSLYTLVACGNVGEPHRVLAMELILGLFHMALPFLRPGIQKIRESRKVAKPRQEKNDEADQNITKYSSEVFTSLCELVDQDASARLHRIAKSVILDGAEVFFPDAQARRAHLLSLIDKVMEDHKAVSLAYTFESLCRFFSNKDASGLLGLPESLPKDGFQPDSVIYVMKTLVAVAFGECLTQAKDESGTDSPSNLVLLLCAMQKSLLAWCHIQCGIDGARQIAVDLLLEYVALLTKKSCDVLDMLLKGDEALKVVDRLEYSFVSVSLRQLILFLNLFSSLDVNCVQILCCLQPLASKLRSIAGVLPELFSSKSSLDWTEEKENFVLREWEVESAHEYENNSNVTKVFNCPGCSSFRVEFDPKCETERRYDFLEFTDSTGCKRRFDQKVGTEKWPNIVEFSAGEKLHFLFHSDGSTTEWGYKFKVFAIGCPNVAVSWLYDLELNLAHCFGVFCSNALDMQKALGTKLSLDENEEERALLHNELWASLFRGGYMVGKLERSLSGFHRNNPSDSMVNTFLTEVAFEKTDRARDLIEKCKKCHTGQRIGGPDVDSAVYTVFSAMMWHTQEIREQISQFVEEDIPADVPSSVMNAYSAAESIRRVLLENRQKLLLLLDEQIADCTRQQPPCNPETPVISCREKALFLLKFAGLSKLVAKKQRESTVAVEKKTSVLSRSRSLHKSEVPDQRRNSRHLSEELSVFDKYPTFRMVVDFVTNESLSHDRIHDLLQHRRKYASTVACVYSFAADYIYQSSVQDIFQVPSVLFLQNFLLLQSKFPQHYADYLNGCGLELENHVRKAFYTLIRRICDGVQDWLRKGRSGSTSPVFACARAYLLHLLDIEWKAYDHSFIMELELPRLLIGMTQGTTAHTSAIEEEAELQMYDRHNKFFSEAKNQGIDAWCEEHREKAPADVQRDINLFIARFSPDLEVVITCDGCQKSIKGRRYRCLNCIDMDLCIDCYSGSVRPNDHSDQHEVIDLRFKCDNCDAFIVGTRIHCMECKDFDLCFGCYHFGKFPQCHNSLHNVKKYQLISRGLLPNKSTSSGLQSYIHHHSWLQFSALALTLSESIQNRRTQGMDPEYLKAAGRLLLDCMRQIVGCLLLAEGQSMVQDTVYDIHPEPSKCALDNIEEDASFTRHKVTFEPSETVIDICDSKDMASSNLQVDITESDSSCLTIPNGNNPLLPIKTLEKNDQSGLVDAITETYPSLVVDGSKKQELFASASKRSSDLPSVFEPEAVDRSISSKSQDLPPLPELEDLENDSRPLRHASGSDMETVRESFSRTSVAEIVVEGCPSFQIGFNVSQEVGFERKASVAVVSDTHEQNENDSCSLTDDSLGKTVKEDQETPAFQSSDAYFHSAKKEDSLDVIDSRLLTRVYLDDHPSGSEEILIRDAHTNFDKTTEETAVKLEKSNFEVTLKEKLLGLLGAIIPPNRHLSVFPDTIAFSAFVSRELLPALFCIIRSQEEEQKLKMIALGVLTKVLQCFGPEVADDAVRFANTGLLPSFNSIECTSLHVTTRSNVLPSADTSDDHVHSKRVAAVACDEGKDISEPAFPGAHEDLSSSMERNRESFVAGGQVCDSHNQIIKQNSLAVVDADSDTSLCNAMSAEAVGSLVRFSSSEVGTLFAEFLFKLGAECLHVADLETASSVESVLKHLSAWQKWRDSILGHAQTRIKELADTPKVASLSSIFSLMFFAGFPDMFRVGSLAQIREHGNEAKDVAILHVVPERGVLTVVNFRNRKKSTVKEHNVENVSTWYEAIDDGKLSLLLSIIHDALADGKATSMSVERIWVLGLALKAFHGYLKLSVSKEGILQIAKHAVVRLIIKLACGGTGFSKQWLLRDLEVLSWRLYRCGSPAPCVATTSKPSPTEDQDVEDNSLKAKVDDSRSPLHGLDEETKLCMETIHDALDCPYPLLRAIYEHFGRDRDKLVEEVHRSFDGSGCSIRASEEIQELAKQWENHEEKLEEPKEKILEDSSIDVGVLKFQPQAVELRELQAKPETPDNPYKLIASVTEEEIHETRSRQRRAKSSELLRDELEKQHENIRDAIRKVNFAVAIGYARHVVGYLFANWPEGKEISLSTLDDMPPASVVGLLDLIQSVEEKEHFRKVVFNFIRSCNKGFVQPLALSAVHCMGEVRLASEVRESDHKYKNNVKLEDKVHIAGATSLFIRFDERCSTEYNCDELVLSSSANFLQNRRVFSGSTGWQDFEMPGDTVYYKFTSDSTNNDWGWKFIITGGQLGRFETGCAILNALLAQDIKFARTLPLKQLWQWLIVVACNQVGQQRLMATGLLLRILQISAGDPFLFGTDIGASPEEERPTLSSLRPLWTLYTNSLETDVGTSLALISPVIRGLSELFLVVENVAQDWGEADDLVAGLATDDKMRRAFTRVVTNIAAIGVAINLPNKALDLLQNAPNFPAPELKHADAGARKKRTSSTYELRITNNGDGDSELSDDGLLFDDDTPDENEDDDDDDDEDGNGDDVDDDANDSDDSDGTQLTEPELPLE